jgi:hypothetical protein
MRATAHRPTVLRGRADRLDSTGDFHDAGVSRLHAARPDALGRAGIVTLSNQEREKPPSRVISSDRNGRTPRAHRRGSKGSVGMGGCEVALDVENVVDDGMR